MNLAATATSSELLPSIEIAAVCVAAISVVVTVCLWRLSGWRLEVRAFHERQYTRLQPEDAYRPHRPPTNTEKVDITVTNTGRKDARVYEIGVELQYRMLNGRHWGIPHYEQAQPEGDQLPKTLIPSEQLETQLILDPGFTEVLKYRAFARAGNRIFRSQPERFLTFTHGPR
jgi:hypothetical protein